HARGADDARGRPAGRRRRRRVTRLGPGRGVGAGGAPTHARRRGRPRRVPPAARRRRPAVAALPALAPRRDRAGHGGARPRDHRAEGHRQGGVRRVPPARAAVRRARPRGARGAPAAGAAVAVRPARDPLVGVAAHGRRPRPLGAAAARRGRRDRARASRRTGPRAARPGAALDPRDRRLDERRGACAGARRRRRRQLRRLPRRQGRRLRAHRRTGRRRGSRRAAGALRTAPAPRAAARRARARRCTAPGRADVGAHPPADPPLTPGTPAGRCGGPGAARHRGLSPADTQALPVPHGSPRSYGGAMTRRLGQTLAVAAHLAALGLCGPLLLAGLVSLVAVGVAGLFAAGFGVLLLALAALSFWWLAWFEESRVAGLLGLDIPERPMPRSTRTDWVRVPHTLWVQVT